jgi:glycerophosphoryl diester phosphodiesterase
MAIGLNVKSAEKQMAGIRIFGHRGARGRGNPPENSLAAFQAAIDQGADGIELDLFLTKDNQLIVFHDDDLERMTDEKGNITSRTLDDLIKLRLKDVDGNFTDQQIPTYKEVLDLIEANRHKAGQSPLEHERLRNFTVNTEIKGLGIATQVADEIRRRLGNGWKPNGFQVSSFDMESLREMKRSLDIIPRGALFAGSVRTPKMLRDITEDELKARIDETRDIAPDSINITLPSLTPKTVRMIKDAGARPVAWMCNEENPMPTDVPSDQAKKEAAFLREHGIDLITDFPKQRVHMLRALEKATL